MMMETKKNNKIAIITPYLSGKGGTETVLSIILSNDKYLKRFEKVDLIVLGDFAGNQWTKKLSENVCIHFSTNLNMIRILVLVFRILTNRYDKVICMSTRILRITYSLRKIFRRKFKIISWIHFSLFHESTVIPDNLKYADYNLAISSGINRQMKSLGINDNDIGLIFNPIEKKNRVINSSHNKKPEFAYIGRILLDGQKNLRELFNGIRLLKNNSIVLHLYGDGEINECQDYIRSLDIKQTIIWHGWTKNPWGDFKTMDAIILTSKYEGLPMVLLESISYGIPVISSNCPTGPEDIVNKNNGFLYKMKDVHALANLLSKIKESNFDHRLDGRSLIAVLSTARAR